MIFNRRKTKIGAIVFEAVFLFTIDRYLKYWAIHLLYNQKVDLIKNWLTLDFFKNENIAFSLPMPSIIIIPLVSIVLAVLIYYFFKSFKQKLVIQNLALLFIILGATSNLYDRLQYNYVIDYIDVKYWPTVFNLADIMISLGVIVLIAILFKKNKS